MSVLILKVKAGGSVRIHAGNYKEIECKKYAYQSKGGGVCSIIQCRHLYKHLQASRKLLTHFQKETDTSINNTHVNYFENTYPVNVANRNTFSNNLTTISKMHM